MYILSDNDRKRPFFTHKRIIFLLLALLIMMAIPTGVLLALKQQQSTPGLLRKGTPNNLSPVEYVDPLIGTGAQPQDLALGGFAGGNVFPGASYPHGMVQWSPDNAFTPGGYRYNESLIRGFSLTHFSGRGCNAYQDFPFMPSVGQIHTSPATTLAYATHYSHSNEVAAPGYYSVLLDQQNIQVALTATARTGFGQFTYPPSTDSALLINAGGSATGDDRAGTGVQIIGDNQVVGSASSGGFCGQGNTYKIYFAAMFGTHFSASSGTWDGDTVTPGSHKSTGSHSGAFLYFDTTGKRTVQVKVGISFVSIENARLNLQRENPGWNFQAVRNRAQAVWSARLGQIAISGGTGDQKTVFYTALYHTLFHPNIFSDVNGQYIGFDDKVHTARGYTQYENFPGWDMYRSLIALLALLEPRETGDMLQSLVADARQGGGALPRWEVANDNSGGMVGDSMDVLFATSYALGVRNFDAEAALRAMELGASNPAALSGKHHPREGLSDYLKLGYVSTRTTGSASITLEYTTDDYAIAQLAKALGHKDVYATYLLRSQNWEHLFDTASGYITPRNADGTYLAGFAPTSGTGFVEGDSAQYTWMVPYDLHQLFTMMGGNIRVLQRLDDHFKQLNAGATSPYAFMGNEPEFEAPWEYDFASAPYRTQDVVRRIETQHFSLSAGGLPGNDDGGAMSSWYVFAALGFYPEIPGTAGFALGSPLFPAATIHLSNGHDLHIIGQGAAENAPYVQRLSINGNAYNSAWLPFAKIKNGATLQFDLGATPAPGALNGI